MKYFLGPKIYHDNFRVCGSIPPPNAFHRGEGMGDEGRGGEGRGGEGRGGEGRGGEGRGGVRIG